MIGEVFGVGVGPGDSDLITLRGLRALQSCDVLVYPCLDDGKSLARHIIDSHMNHQPIEETMNIIMGQDASGVYEHMAQVICGHVAKGRRVVILCGGDPFFYGSYIYLFNNLQQRGIHAQTIPGVSSIMASASALGIPLACGLDVLTVLPCSLPDHELRDHLSKANAFALIKLGRHFSRICLLLKDMGLMSNAYYAQQVSFPHQRVCPLSEVSHQDQVPYFSMILCHRRG